MEFVGGGKGHRPVDQDVGLESSLGHCHLEAGAWHAGNGGVLLGQLDVPQVGCSRGLENSESHGPVLEVGHVVQGRDVLLYSRLHEAVSDDVSVGVDLPDARARDRKFGVFVSRQEAQPVVVRGEA